MATRSFGTALCLQSCACQLGNHARRWRLHGTTPLQLDLRRCDPNMQCASLSTSSSFGASSMPSSIPTGRCMQLRTGIVLGSCTVLLTSWATRSYYDYLRHGDMHASVHQDHTSVEIKRAKQQVGVEKTIVVDYKGEDGNVMKVVVDKTQLDQVLSCSKRAEALGKAEKTMQEVASQQLANGIERCFLPLNERVSKFADWYFAYSTSFRLLREAVTSVARHTADISRSVPLHHAVAADIDSLIMNKYERIVLQPELNDAKLQEMFLAVVQEVHRQFCTAVSDAEMRLLVELAKRTSHLEEPSQDAIHLKLDWASQLHKVKVVPAQFEKTPELSLALSAGGVLAGKATGTAAGSKVIGTMGAKVAASKAMAGKFGSPFVTKALAAGSGAVAGALTGPLGALVGGAAGVGADYVVNLGLELMQRRDFENEVDRVLQATQRDYFKSLEAEVHRAINVWVSDAVQLLPVAAANLTD